MSCPCFRLLSYFDLERLGLMAWMYLRARYTALGACAWTVPAAGRVSVVDQVSRTADHNRSGIAVDGYGRTVNCSSEFAG